jgi:hypothetical protein
MRATDAVSKILTSLSINLECVQLNGRTDDELEVAMV